MSALLAIGWAVWLFMAVVLVLDVVGWRGLTNMFPEGWRWWHLPAQLATLAHFAAVVHFNPWR